MSVYGANADMVQTVPGVHVYIGRHYGATGNMLCAGNMRCNSGEKGAQNKSIHGLNRAATYTCTPGSLFCWFLLNLSEFSQRTATLLCNKSCICVHKCIYTRENKKNMGCMKKGRCTCVHCLNAMYTWKARCTPGRAKI